MSPPVAHATWPCLPPAPDRTPTLLRLPGAGPRARARAATRQAAQATLAVWCGTPVTWRETATGPRPEGGALAREHRVSFTYAGEDAWIAFHRGPVGLDACPLADFPERSAVARLYLPEAPADESPTGFARRWARREATLKQLGRGLTEGPTPAPPGQLLEWTEGGVTLALAWS